MSRVPGPPRTGPYQQKVPQRRSESSEAWKVTGPDPVVDDVNTFATREANRFPCELPFGIYDYMIGARTLRDSNLVFVGHTTDHPATSQLDDLGQ
jgi:hypothetical protein